ncbi:MAG: histidine phosphatase family protein [Alphaproteobacteria bacterium]
MMWQGDGQAAASASALRELIVVRHGETTFNRENRVTGQLDPALTDHGRAQAEALCALLATFPLTAIYASPLIRSVQTACPTAVRHGLPVQILDELMEQHLGALQGRSRSGADPVSSTLSASRRHDDPQFRFPGGESATDLRARVRCGLARICADISAGIVLIVAHKRVNQALLGLLLDSPVEGLRGLRMPNGSACRVTLHPTPHADLLGTRGQPEQGRRRQSR